MTKLSLKEQCKALKLAYVQSIYLKITCHDREQYLTDLFAAELEARWANRVRHLIKKAGFPAHKTMNDIDWKPVTLPASTTITHLTELTFIERCENVLALGAVGTGKTYLAIALGVRVCMEGRIVRFYRCLDLVNALLESHRPGSFAAADGRARD